MPHWEFPRSEPIDLSAHLPAGSVVINAGPVELITVDVTPTRSGKHAEEYADQVRVEFTDGHLDVREPEHFGWLRLGSGLDCVITVPAGSRCDIEVASADISCTGELAALTVQAASGEIRATTVTGLTKVTNASGKVTIGTTGEATIKTASGGIELGRVSGDIEAISISGKVEIRAAGAAVTARTSSGKVRIGSFSRGLAKVDTVSGDIFVNVTPGAAVFLDLASLSGKVSSDLDSSSEGGQVDQVDVRLQCRSVSGAVKIGRAALADQPA